MNIKPLNREELQNLFNRFEDIPNINEILVLGTYEQLRDEAVGVGKVRYNPNYKFLHKYDEDGVLEQTIPTVKIMVKIPSENRTRKNGDPFTTNLPLFATDGGVDVVKALDIGDHKTHYVLCRGKVQNFFVTRRSSPSPQVAAYLKKWCDMYRGEYDERLVMKILRILRMSLDANDNVQLPMLNVWIHDITDGTDSARDLADENKRIGINSATISGLVYMPPSLRLYENGQKGRIHFKVRVKRQDKEGQTVPIAQQAKEGYDIINVIYEGKDASDIFGKLRQGYPVKVTGSLENYTFSQKAEVNFIEQKQLSELLGTPALDSKIQDIVRFVDNADIRETIPSYNVLAKSVDCDYKNW